MEDDYQDVDSIDHHWILVHVRVHVHSLVEVSGRVEVFGNCLKIVWCHSRKGPLKTCMKLVVLNYMVCHISANRHRGRYWDHSSCILYYRLFISSSHMLGFNLTFLTIMVLWINQ